MPKMDWSWQAMWRSYVAYTPLDHSACRVGWVDGETEITPHISIQPIHPTYRSVIAMTRTVEASDLSKGTGEDLMISRCGDIPLCPYDTRFALGDLVIMPNHLHGNL